MADTSAVDRHLHRLIALRSQIHELSTVDPHDPHSDMYSLINTPLRGTPLPLYAIDDPHSHHVATIAPAHFAHFHSHQAAEKDQEAVAASSMAAKSRRTMHTRSELLDQLRELHGEEEFEKMYAEEGDAENDDDFNTAAADRAEGDDDEAEKVVPVKDRPSVYWAKTWRRLSTPSSGLKRKRVVSAVDAPQQSGDQPAVQSGAVGIAAGRACGMHTHSPKFFPPVGSAQKQKKQQSQNGNGEGDHHDGDDGADHDDHKMNETLQQQIRAFERRVEWIESRRRSGAVSSLSEGERVQSELQRVQKKRSQFSRVRK